MTKPSNGNILLVANWESNVGYAWWLMENFWTTIAKHFDDRSCFLIYPKITVLPESISTTSIKTSELNFSDHSIGNLIKIAKLSKVIPSDTSIYRIHPATAGFISFCDYLESRKLLPMITLQETGQYLRAGRK